MEKNRSTDGYNVNNDYIQKIIENGYDGEKNPNGIINFGTAYSYLCENVLEEKLESLCKITKNTCRITASHGDLLFRKALAVFYAKMFKSKQTIDPEKLIVVNGTSSCIDCLTHCIAEPGVKSLKQLILIPTPMYTYLHRNVNLRSGAEFWPIKQDYDGFQLNAHQVEAAIEEATKSGKTVRGLVLVNPNNPLGEVYGSKLITEVLLVCKKYGIHVIMDEIQGLTVFDNDVTFRSVATYETIPDPERTHVIWSFSKDFALPSMRVAVLYSYAEKVYQSMKALSPFFVVPTIAQDICRKLVEDLHWCEDVFFPFHLKLLRSNYEFVVEKLTCMGVTVKSASSGFVVIANFQKFLAAKTFEAEKRLLESMLSQGIFITPGDVMYFEEPGWFRVLFAAPRELLEIGLNRIELALNLTAFNTV